MWARVFLIIILLLSASTFAQSLPDFSGVFLRNLIERHGPAASPEDPLVLVIKQGVDNLQITEMQNGAQTTNVYDLKGKPSINVSADGVHTKDRVKFKDGRLMIKSQVAASGRAPVVGLSTEEVWALSPDLQTLTIRLKGVPLGFEVRGSRQMENYTRQTSLGAALEKAQWASGMTLCNASSPFMAKLPTLIPDHGVVLGYTGFQQLGWQISFLAGLSGDFFDDLKHGNAPGAVEFRNQGRRISTYSGSLMLQVTPQATRRMGVNLSTLPLQMGGEPLPGWLLNLRFRVEWVGSESRNLGEVPSELKQQPWPELSIPEKWYRMEIPAQDVPLTDSLEIHVLSSDGKQLGCISGHI